jgi:hypothetical protein
VYSCRSSSSWEHDLALSATHYAHGLTFAILYGTSSKVEKNVLERLQRVGNDSTHPLLLPGIFAELELVRHTGLVESNINQVETKIFELDSQSSNPQKRSKAEVEMQNQSKREAWLNLSYLRNDLTTWKTQILRMIEHAASHKDKSYRSHGLSLPFIDNVPPIISEDGHRGTWIEHRGRILTGDENTAAEYRGFLRFNDGCGSQSLSFNNKEDTDDCPSHTQDISEKIKARLIAIRDDYEEKIRDCNMRVDGMAMATQWVCTPDPSLRQLY